LRACAVTSQCATGRVCDPRTRNCLPPDSEVEQSGCSCRLGSRPGSAACALALGALLGLWARSRRRTDSRGAARDR
jgi:MYXO-CTERM domain-containing protein